MKKLSKPDLLLLIIAIGLLVYTGLRAAIISMTHDESSTYLNYINQPLLECFYSEVCWGTANLHLVNTFLMQISVKLFGPHPFFVRLPNVLAHAIYLFFSFKLIRNLTDKWGLMLAGFLIINAHPYLLDFFSLARGYGLACGFTMMSLYFLYKLIQTSHWKTAFWCIMGAGLAVLSNFTFLNYFAILSASIGIWTLFLSKESGYQRWIPLGINCISAAVLALLLYNPIIFLKGGGEFGYGVASLWQTFTQLVQDDLYGQGYFEKYTNEIFIWILTIITGISLLLGLGRFFAKERTSKDIFHILTALMWVILVLALFTQNRWLGTQYLHRRTALIFFPLTALPVFMLLFYLSHHLPKVGNILCIIISIFLLNHFGRTSNLIVAREWYYDAHTHEMLQYLEEKIPQGEEVHLGVYWLYTHSCNFYRETQDLAYIKYIDYEREIRKDSLYDYYYVEPGHGEIIHPDYELDKRFGWVAHLYKRKGMP